MVHKISERTSPVKALTPLPACRLINDTSISGRKIHCRKTAGKRVNILQAVESSTACSHFLNHFVSNLKFRFFK